MDSKDIGDISELAVMLEFKKKGIPVFIPFGDSCSFDLVVYASGRFYRIEVKTGRPTGNGCITFDACSCTYEGGRNRKRVNYIEKADIFAVYYPLSQKIYLIPINKDLPTSEVVLRVDPPKNGHKKYIRWASNYEFDIQLERLFRGVV